METPIVLLFVGGPMDGSTVEVPALPDPTTGRMGPPMSIEMSQLGVTLHNHPLDPHEDVPVKRFVYVCRVNPLDTGPLWIAVPADPEYTDPYDVREPPHALPGTPGVPDSPDDWLGTL